MVNLSYLQEVKCVSSFAEIFTPSLLSNAMNNLPKSMKICYSQLYDHIQLTLVISTSVISNNRLSR